MIAPSSAIFRTSGKASVVDCDMIGAGPGTQIKRPDSAVTEDGADPITFRKVGLMPIVPSTHPSDQQAIALQYLALTREQMEQAVRNRFLYVKLARAHKITNQAIGDALGLSETRVRQIAAS